MIGAHAMDGWMDDVPAYLSTSTLHNEVPDVEDA
jgi:hypothetical protein